MKAIITNTLAYTDYIIGLGIKCAFVFVLGLAVASTGPWMKVLNKYSDPSTVAQDQPVQVAQNETKVTDVIRMLDRAADMELPVNSRRK